MVARVDVSQNDLPWEFMTDHVPNVLFFPRGRKDQSVPFPPEAPLTLPNLLRFALGHSSPPPPGSGPFQGGFQQGRVSHLEREVETLRAELQSLHRAQAHLQGQLQEAKREGRGLQQEVQALWEHQGHLQCQREHLRGLYEQKTRELEAVAEKLQELAAVSERLLAEYAFLKEDLYANFIEISL
ncbi:hypothetical protein JRQ81_010396 [Phrynocephalus forsythii]|uniref:Uncharacterized protein n=1 Tax=Phrynocephalus forsythii TaxID=171643 RepID=A0A9Q0X8G2_9SAUR|nr:hypothetical protein JRQ81_010396 [Phrynocephalus forsythii]